MPGALGAGAASISLSTFAWGAVWMPSFGSAFAHPLTRAALAKAARGGGSAVVLGSSLGYEVSSAPPTHTPLHFLEGAKAPSNSPLNLG